MHRAHRPGQEEGRTARTRRSSACTRPDDRRPRARCPCHRAPTRARGGSPRGPARRLSAASIPAAWAGAAGATLGAGTRQQNARRAVASSQTRRRALSSEGSAGSQTWPARRSPQLPKNAAPTLARPMGTRTSPGLIVVASASPLRVATVTATSLQGPTAPPAAAAQSNGSRGLLGPRTTRARAGSRLGTIRKLRGAVRAWGENVDFGVFFEPTLRAPQVQSDTPRGRGPSLPTRGSGAERSRAIRLARGAAVAVHCRPPGAKTADFRRHVAAANRSVQGSFARFLHWGKLGEGGGTRPIGPRGRRTTCCPRPGGQNRAEMRF